MENHELSIGLMKTACRMPAYPEAVAPLRNRLDRSIGGPFNALLAKAAEPVLHGRNGVIRIRNLKLDLAHNGDWDELTLANLFASKLAGAIAAMLDLPGDAVRYWPDHDAYMAAFIESKLGLAHEPDWAFPEFAPLRLLSPEQAACEVLKARPSALSMLAANGRRVGNAQRLAMRLSEASATGVVAAWLKIPEIADGLVAVDLAGPAWSGILHRVAPDPRTDFHRHIMILALEADYGVDRSLHHRAIPAAIVFASVAVLSADKTFSTFCGDLPSAAIEKMEAAELPLPVAVGSFVKQAITRKGAGEAIDQLYARMAGKKSASGKTRLAIKGQRKTAKAKAWSILSPFAGFAFLLPEIVRHGMHRQLSKSGLRTVMLAIVEPDMRERLDQDELLLTLFPEDENTEPATYPPVPGPLLTMLAPESRHLVSGRQGADGWADALLAGFASRLPGLRASSRGYLIRQFLAIEGRADIADDAILVTFDGPPLAIVLKMAGLSGEQMPIPFFGNRLLILKPGGGR